jgi:hypothetical protein
MIRNFEKGRLRGGVNLFFVAVFLLLAGSGLVGCRSIPLDRSHDVQVQCQRDLQQAVQLRGLNLKREIDIQRESPEMLGLALAAELDKPENHAFLSTTAVLLQQLRVIKPDDDLKSLFLKVMGQQVAAYYDPEKKRVVYVEGGVSQAISNSAAKPLVDRFVYVHEFCHALEDSHFDIERLTRESLSDFDRNLAVTSLIEGDAMLVGLDSVFAESPVNTATPLGACVVQVMGHMDLASEMKAMGDCPAFLGGALIRPYLDGAIFSNRIRREAGWSAVDAIFTDNVPKTTAEILFPERKFLNAFTPATFHPVASLLGSAGQSVLTNRVGAMGMALWLGGDALVRPRQYERFLSGWMGDEIYFSKAADGHVEKTVWLSYWERAGHAGRFCRQVKRRLSASFKDVSWRVERKGRLVAIVWSDELDVTRCEDIAKKALDTSVEAQAVSGFLSWCSDLPWPMRFPRYNGYSGGFELLGGHMIDVASGDPFFRVNLADGLIFRAESNPDRSYWGTLGGLVRFVRDERSAFSCWHVPVLANWFRRGSGDNEQYKWSVLWGLAGYGDERKARILLIPVWHAKTSTSGH